MARLSLRILVISWSSYVTTVVRLFRHVATPLWKFSALASCSAAIKSLQLLGFDLDAAQRCPDRSWRSHSTVHCLIERRDVRTGQENPGLLHSFLARSQGCPGC